MSWSICIYELRENPDLSQQASIASLSDRLNTIFNYSGGKVSIHALRSSYVYNAQTVKQLKGQQLSVTDKESIEIKMRNYINQEYLEYF